MCIRVIQCNQYRYITTNIHKITQKEKPLGFLSNFVLIDTTLPYHSFLRKLLSPLHSFFAKTITGFDILTNILRRRVFPRKTLGLRNAKRFLPREKEAFRLPPYFALIDTTHRFHSFLRNYCRPYIVFLQKTITGFDILTNILTRRVFRTVPSSYEAQ